MKRFTAGLLIGAFVAGIAWAAGASPVWTAVAGVAVAVVVGVRLHDRHL